MYVTVLEIRTGKEGGGQGRNRTADASLFRAALYRLSYLALSWKHHFTRPPFFSRFGVPSTGRLDWREPTSKVRPEILVYSALSGLAWVNND